MLTNTDDACEHKYVFPRSQILTTRVNGWWEGCGLEGVQCTGAHHNLDLGPGPQNIFIVHDLQDSCVQGFQNLCNVYHLVLFLGPHNISNVHELQESLSDELLTRTQ